MTTALLPSAGAALGTENDFARKSKGTGQRKSMPKVKTGCSNCKKRRIKCDETRPVCNNCDKSQRVDPSTCKYPPPSHRPGLQPLIAPKPATPLASAAPNLRPSPPTISAREAGSTTTNQLIPISQPRSHQLVPVAPSRRDHKMEVRTRLTPLDNPHGLPISSHQIPLPPAPSQTQLQMLYQPPVMQFTELEGMYFQLFQQSTANELSGYFDYGFWTRSVLQEAYAETTIRHAVVALGALYKTLEKSSESPPCSPNSGIDPFDTPYRHWKAAIEQYSQALTEMRRLKELDRDSGRTQLMAHVLLACFDSFIGDHKHAIRQIQNGLGLLEKLRNAHRTKFFPSSDEVIDADLIRMFTRLAIQAKTYDMAFHFPDPYIVRLTPQPSPNEPMSPISEPASPSPNGLYYIPTQFSSLIEARIAWDTLVFKIFRFREVMFQTNNGPLGLLPRDIQRHGESFHRQMMDWNNAFTPLCNSRHERSAQEKQGIAALKMTYIMSFILSTMTFDSSEMNFDQFTSDFKSIVDLALEIVTDQERIAAAAKGCSPEWCLHKQFGKRDIFDNTESEFLTHHIKPSFSADMGIVQPLYVVATKCRDPVIRRQAIQLLMNSARREAMWDSELSARIGSWITQIEEGEDFMSPTPSPHMPQGQFNPVSPDGALSVISPASSGLSGSMADFGDALGPGGNARWESIPRRASLFSPPPVVRENKRVMVYSVEMNLRERWAKIRCGTRGLRSGSMDVRSRETQISW